MTFKPTPAGEFKHSIQIYRDTGGTQNPDTGQTPSNWQQLASGRAKLETGGTRRFEAARQIVANATHLWVMPYSRGLVLTNNPEKEEIRWRGRRFAVHAVENVGGHDRELNITTVETQTGG